MDCCGRATATGAFPQTKVDYNAVIAFKHRLLEKAWANFSAGARADLRAEYEQFLQRTIALAGGLCAVPRAERRNSTAHITSNGPRSWSSASRRRSTGPGANWPDQIGQMCFAQFLLFRQGERLKAYAHANGVRLIGDLPFFVSPDSSDVWAHPELFLLDEQRRPRFVAGVPPDYFSAHGQLWGNPVYDWEALRGVRLSLVHRPPAVAAGARRRDSPGSFPGFRGGLARARRSSDGAEPGKWVPGPGADFFQAVEKELGALPFIAEDLGMITPDVYALRDNSKLPGMRVLQFAFDGHVR